MAAVAVKNSAHCRLWSSTRRERCEAQSGSQLRKQGWRRDPEQEVCAWLCSWRAHLVAGFHTATEHQPAS